LYLEKTNETERAKHVIMTVMEPVSHIDSSHTSNGQSCQDQDKIITMISSLTDQSELMSQNIITRLLHGDLSM